MVHLQEAPGVSDDDADDAVASGRVEQDEVDEGKGCVEQSGLLAGDLHGAEFFM